MVICQYYLKGNCRFGERCFNEHRKPDNRGNHYQAGRGKKNYQQEFRYNNNNNRNGNYDKRYESHESRFNHKATNYSFKQSNHSNYQSYDHVDIDEDSQRYSGRTHFSKDKYHYDARNKNRFSTLRHQPEPESHSFHGNRFSSPRANFHSTPTQHPRKSQEQKLEKIRKDMREWEESGQWPLSCYSPLGNEPCLNGLNDISAEEMRVEAYEANHNKSGFRYAQEVQTILQNYSQRKHELANMSSFSLEEELSNSSKPAVTLPPGGLFGNQDSLHLSASENTLGGSMDVSSSSLFSSNPSSSSKTSTFLPVTTNSTSALFQSNQVDVPFARSLSPIAEDVSNDQQTFPTPKCSVSSLRCSEDDLKAFRADRFIMGAVPECPPPLELC